MSNIVKITFLEENIFELDIQTSSISQKSELAFYLHNAKVQIKECLERIELREEELYKVIENIIPAKIDVEGKLMTTEVINQDGENIALLEYKQSNKRIFNEQKTRINLETANCLQVEDFYEIKLKSLEKIEKILIKSKLPSEAIASCFDVERSQPKITFIKKI